MADELPRRWRHVQAVGAKAESLGPAFGDEAELLTMAAWLHDIGYARSLQDTGFHPLDGARYLRRLGVEVRLCSLVANHSGALAEADLRGLTDEMADFPDEGSEVRDAVWYCDMTTSPVGKPTVFNDRLAEIRNRYGSDHTVPRGIEAVADEIRAAVWRTEMRASRAGIGSV
jgi:putative nucleotidyltransferase with HDIG domain